MAFSPNLQCLLICCLYVLCFTYLCSSAIDVHDLLPTYKLPKGLVPRNVKSYSLSKSDNSFTVELSTQPCYVKFNDQLVLYDRIITGKLKSGEVYDVSGIKAKQFFLWVTVTGIDVDEKNGMIEFHAGVLSKSLPAKEFESIHSCKANANVYQESNSYLDASI